MGFKFSKQSLERLEGVDPRLVELAKRSIEKSPIDFGIPSNGGKRSIEDQKKLFKQGVTKCDGVKKKSNHQLGKAFDVFAYHNGKASWNQVHLAMIAGVVLSTAKEMGMNVRWGGTFGSKNFQGWDMPHFEIID